jgi:hypothetical protein
MRGELDVLDRTHVLTYKLSVSLVRILLEGRVKFRVFIHGLEEV